MPPARQASLWTCPRCGHQFTSPNLPHSCGRFRLDDHFRGRDIRLRKAFRGLVQATRHCGPATVYAQKSRIVFMVRVRFASVVVGARALRLGLWLTRKVEHPLAFRVERLGPRVFYTYFRLASPDDIDPDLRSLMCEAHRIGRQEPLSKRSAK